jgi:predicted small secreted protein
MRVRSAILVVLIAMISLTGCYTMKHTVGAGAKGSQTESAKQWFALWGLVALNNPDTKEMAHGATDYTIMTQQSFLDGLIGMFTMAVTIQPRTVEVTR